jgi:hypothetical protein
MDSIAYKITCISHNRAEGLQNFFEIVGTADVTFFVKDQEDYDNYIKAGAKEVIISGGLMHSRNAALEHCFAEGKICIQLSDDIVKCTLNVFDGKRTHQQVTVLSAIEDVIADFAASPYKFAGFPPTDNPFFALKEKEYNKFIVGDFIIVKPNPLRFDENMRLKEDYDYTLQHIKEYKGCVRYGKYLNTFKHYSNKGGAVAYRTSDLEQDTINYLINKWGECIVKNTKRENEILLNKNTYDILHTTQQTLWT